MTPLLLFYGAALLAFVTWQRRELHTVEFRAALRSTLFVGSTAWAVRGWSDGSGFLPALTETLALLALLGTPRRHWPLPLALLATLPFLAITEASPALLTLPFRWAAGLMLESLMRQRRFPVLRALMHGVSFMGSAAWLLPLHLRHVLWVQPEVTPERTLRYGLLWLAQRFAAP